MDGIEVLRRIKRSSPGIQVIATAYRSLTALAGSRATSSTAVQAVHFTELDAVLDRAAREPEPAPLPAHPRPAGPTR
jgi:hypothetical protein